MAEITGRNHVVTVRTGARLHFGLLAVNPLSGRRFGGVGLMISEPGIELQGTWASSDEVIGGSANAQRRIFEFLRRYRESFGPIPSVRIAAHQEIPGHQGLGSGTQLGLATTMLLHRMTHAEPCSAMALAGQMGRGNRSAIGIHGFDHGGFLVEAGKLRSDEISPLVARVDTPPDWRLLLITPPEAEGLAGSAEQQAFGRMASMPASTTATLCRIVLMDWLPAMAAADFRTAAQAMYEYGKLVGEFFAPIQGDVFADRRMTSLVGELRRQGISGVAQTSWGPTIAVLRESQESAEDLRDLIAQDARGIGCQLRIVAPLNRAAQITIERTSSEQ